MEYKQLGNTDMNVSVVGLGCGGYSKLGLGVGKSENNAVEVVQTALGLGVNFFDTAKVYGTEKVLGKGLAHAKREDIVVSTKFSPFNWKKEALEPKGSFTVSLDESLKNLKTDYVDIYNFHAVRPQDYHSVVDRFMPEVEKALESGKIRYLGITESFIEDPAHKMLEMALESNAFKVMMIGYNMLNFTARHNILPITLEKGIGTLNMFAVRNAFSNKKRLVEIVNNLIASGKIDSSLVDCIDPFGFVVNSGEINSITEVAYRFCRHTKGMDVIMTGTSSPEHLKKNIDSILSDSLELNVLDKIYHIFKEVDCTSGQ